MKNIVIIITISLMLVGCSRDVKTTMYKDSLANGISYRLPKAVIDVTVPYTVVTRKHMKNGIEIIDLRETEVVVEKPISVSSKLIADPKYILIASGKEVTNDAFLESDLNISFSNQGLISSAGLDVTDKTIETTTALVSAGVKAAAIAAIAGEKKDDAPDGINKIKLRISAIYLEINSMSEKNSKDKMTKLAELRKELDFLHSVLEEYQSKNKVVEERSDISYTTTLDPEGFTRSGEYIEKTIAPGGIVKGVQAAGMPPIKISLKVSANQEKAASTCDLPTEGVDGIVYRIPTSIEIVVWNKANESLRQIISIPQYGAYGFARLASKSLGPRVTKISFNPETGGLKEYGAKSGSTADKMAIALDDSVGKVKDAIINFKYEAELQKLDYESKLKDAKEKLKEEPKVDDPTKALKEQKDMLAAELAVVQAQTELQKAKNELLRLKDNGVVP